MVSIIPLRVWSAWRLTSRAMVVLLLASLEIPCRSGWNFMRKGRTSCFSDNCGCGCGCGWGWGWGCALVAVLVLFVENDNVRHFDL